MRHVPQPAGIDVTVRRIKAIHAGIVFSRERVTLPAQSVTEGDAAIDLPMVSRVDSVRLHVNRIWIAQLIDLAGGTWQTEQEIRPAVESAIGRSRIALTARGGAIESEGAPHRLECAALRLKVVELLILVIDAKAKIMRAFQPAQVARDEILIVSE